MAISRSDAESLLARQDGREIWQAAIEFSAALRSFRKVDMGKKLTRYPVLAALPNADFVAGEDADDPTSRKPTTSMSWTHRDLVAEEIAGTVVIPENVLDDAEPEFNLWAEVRPHIAEAVGARLDRAVFFGETGVGTHPSTWPDGLVHQAIAAGNTVTEGDTVPEGTGGANDLAADISAAAGEVEDDGFEARVAYGRRSLARRLTGLRDANNSPIYVQTLAQDGRRLATVGEATFERVTNGAWNSSLATALFGDPRFAILGIRQDLTYKFLDQASVTVDIDGTPTLISLAEHDLLGLRFKMRVGFQTAQVRTLEGGETAYPFSVLQPVGS